MQGQICNLYIERDSHFNPHLREVDNTSSFIGEYVLDKSGKLKRGFNSNLPVRKATLAFAEKYVHYKKGNCSRIYMKDNIPHLEI